MRWIWTVAVVGVAGCGGGPEYGPDPEGRGAGPVEAVTPATPGPAKPERAQPTSEAIHQAIAELGALKKRVRDRATEKLIVFGEWAVPMLREARQSTEDPERALRIETVLRTLGEEGPYVDAIAMLLGQRYEEALPVLARYLEFGRGAYRRQAEYLQQQAAGLAEWQGRNRPLTGSSVRAELDAPGAWTYGTFFHNIYLFFRQRELDARVFYEEARDLYTIATERDATHRRAWACRAALCAAGGDFEEAETAFTTANALPQNNGWDVMDLALYYLAAGREDRAIDLIEQAIPVCNAERAKELAAGKTESEVHPEARWWARESNDFDALKGNPRFEAMVRER